MQTLLGLGLFGMLAVAVIWWLPVIFILRSDRTSGVENLVWVLLIFFLSWFSWILYISVAPVGEKVLR